MADKKATRESYGAALAELGEKYDFLVLDADLAAATKTGMFKKKFPDLFLGDLLFSFISLCHERATFANH